jgi:hypothetical protein
MVSVKVCPFAVQEGGSRLEIVAGVVVAALILKSGP